MFFFIYICIWNNLREISKIQRYCKTTKKQKQKPKTLNNILFIVYYLPFLDMNILENQGHIIMKISSVACVCMFVSSIFFLCESQ